MQMSKVFSIFSSASPAISNGATNDQVQTVRPWKLPGRIRRSYDLSYDSTQHRREAR